MLWDLSALWPLTALPQPTEDLLSTETRKVEVRQGGKKKNEKWMKDVRKKEREGGRKEEREKEKREKGEGRGGKRERKWKRSKHTGPLGWNTGCAGQPQAPPPPTPPETSVSCGTETKVWGWVHYTFQPVAHMPASHTDGKVMCCARSREPAPGLRSFQGWCLPLVLLPRKWESSDKPLGPASWAQRTGSSQGHTGLVLLLSQEGWAGKQRAGSPASNAAHMGFVGVTSPWSPCQAPRCSPVSGSNPMGWGKPWHQAWCWVRAPVHMWPPQGSGFLLLHPGQNWLESRIPLAACFPCLFQPHKGSRKNVEKSGHFSENI